MIQQKYWWLVAASLLVMMFGLLGCSSATTEIAIEQPQQSTYTGKKIMWVDSYHQGYEWSDGMEQGIRSQLDDSGVEFKVVRMDTKRNTDVLFREEAALKAKAEIEAFAPDVLIATDDNAQKYLVVPYLMENDLPIVFSAVNWDASGYGYPTDKITGMIEVNLVRQVMEHLQPFAGGERVGMVTGDTDSERKNIAIYNERFFEGQLQDRPVKTMAEFKTAYLELQEQVDVLILGNYIGIEDWNEQEAEQFIVENTTVPTGSYNDWMAPFVLLLMPKQSSEQGEWAAQTALRVLDGEAPADIPIVENQRADIVINLNLVNKLDIVFPPSLLKNAEVYGE